MGWDFQLQNPVAVAGSSLLIFAVGLNLSGVFEVGSIATASSKRSIEGIKCWRQTTRCNNQEQ